MPPQLLRALLGAAAFGLLAACYSPSGTMAAEVAPPPATPACDEGFTFDSSIGACVEIVAEAACGANRMPEIGKSDCQPVGWTSACPEGFVAGRDGWGCVDRFVGPAPTCAGATREDLRTGKCVPIGNCNAPFPPSAATLFVDDDGIEDATHFRTLKQALGAAGKGATIAVEAGTYGEFIDLFADDVSVVGRCAEKVIFETPTPGGSRSGVRFPALGRARLSGVTITGYRGAIAAEGGELVVEDSLIDGNETLGVYAFTGAKVTIRRSKISHTTPGPMLGSAVVIKTGSVVTLEDSAVVDNYFRHVTVDGRDAAPDVSTLIATRTVFARNTKHTGMEAAITALDGGLVELSRSAVLDSYGQGIHVADEGSRAALDESVVRRSRGTLAENAGIGVAVMAKGVVELVSSAVTDHPVVGVYAGKEGARAVLEKSVVVGVPADQKVEFGRGVSASQGARLEMTDSAVVGCPQSGVGLQMSAIGVFEHVYVAGSRPYDSKTAIGQFGGFGLLVEDGSTATVKRSSFVDNTAAGLTSMHEAEVTADAVLVRGTKELSSFGAGSGLQVGRAKMTVTHCAISGSSSESVVVGSGAVVSMSACTVHGTSRSASGSFGHGIVVFSSGRAELADTAIYDHPGVALVSDGGQAIVRGGVIARSSVAVHAQHGASISQSDATDELADGELRISSTTRFVDDETRIGSGVLALPKPPIE